MPKTKRRPKPKDINRRTKKKVSVLTSERIEYVDWKDVNLLRRFMSERAKIRSRRVTGNSVQQQKMVADAIKVAREMALVAYSNRVTTQRQSKDRSSRLWSDTPMPRPAVPPPTGAADPGSVLADAAAPADAAVPSDDAVSSAAPEPTAAADPSPPRPEPAAAASEAADSGPALSDGSESASGAMGATRP